MRKGFKWGKIIPIVLVVYSAFILVFSLVPDERTAGSTLAWVEPQVQNFLHIPAFGILALLWGWTFQYYNFSERQSMVFASLAAGGMGLLSEGGQAWVPGRYASVTDFLFDLIGIAIVWIFYRRLHLLNWVGRSPHA